VADLGYQSKPGTNVLALSKENGQRFVFLYDDASTREVLQTLGRFAANPDLDFTWFDAAVLSQRVRQLERDQPEEAA
jgi:hypothetical protein